MWQVRGQPIRCRKEEFHSAYARLSSARPTPSLRPTLMNAGEGHQGAGADKSLGKVDIW
jgi:hypothetical protein